MHIDSFVRSCLKKKPLSEDLANKLAIKFNQRTYACPYCNRYHLTSKQRRIRSYKNSQEEAKTQIIQWFRQKETWFNYDLHILQRVGALTKTHNVKAANKAKNAHLAISKALTKVEWGKIDILTISRILNIVNAKNSNIGALLQERQALIENIKTADFGKLNINTLLALTDALNAKRFKDAPDKQKLANICKSLSLSCINMSLKRIKTVYSLTKPLEADTVAT